MSVPYSKPVNIDWTGVSALVSNPQVLQLIVRFCWFYNLTQSFYNSAIVVLIGCRCHCYIEAVIRESCREGHKGVCVLRACMSFNILYLTPLHDQPCWKLLITIFRYCSGECASAVDVSNILLQLINIIFY